MVSYDVHLTTVYMPFNVLLKSVMINSVNKRFFYVHFVRTVIGFVIYHAVIYSVSSVQKEWVSIMFYFAVYLYI